MSKRKLLLADDSVTVQKVVNLAFESEDIEVITANDGNSAFEKFVEFSPDIVLADINMPGADGYEICERIKEDEETRHIPVILLVGSFVPFSEEKADRIGANGFLKKPFQSINLLISKVTELLDMSGTHDSVSSENDFNEADTQPIPVYEPPEMPKFKDDFSTGKDLGETGMDDEMIETERVAEYTFIDETAKYETHSGGFDFGTSEDAEKTQPMTYSEIEEPAFTGQDEETSEETVCELADEPDGYQSGDSYDFSGESEGHSDETTKENVFNKIDYYDDYSVYRQTDEAETKSFPEPESPPALNLDEFELLELPPLETEPTAALNNYSAAAETPESALLPDNSEIKAVEEKTDQPKKDDYSDYAETTAEDSYTMPQTAESIGTQENYFAPTKELPADFGSSETQPQIVEKSPKTIEAETEEYAVSYYSPESATETAKDQLAFDKKEEISSPQSEESATQDFAEKDEPAAQTEIVSQTQTLIVQETQQQISQASDNKIVVHYLPPEVIDEIAERVVEKLAEKLRR